MQDVVNKWWPRSLDSFGKPGSPNDRAYVRLGIKTRSNACTRATFEKIAREELDGLGLEAQGSTN